MGLKLIIVVINNPYFEEPSAKHIAFGLKQSTRQASQLQSPKLPADDTLQ